MEQNTERRSIMDNFKENFKANIFWTILENLTEKEGILSECNKELIQYIIELKNNERFFEIAKEKIKEFKNTKRNKELQIKRNLLRRTFINLDTLIINAFTITDKHGKSFKSQNMSNIQGLVIETLTGRKMF